MRVAVIQSNYIPWRGYFDFIASVDQFVVYDDVQYSKGSWRNRNRVKCPSGALKWLTVPVRVTLGMAIDEVRIGNSAKPWREQHRQTLSESLQSAPHFGDAMALWSDAVLAGDEYLSELNLRLIRGICSYLRINTPIAMARDFQLSGAKTERLLQLLKRLGASSYLSGPSAMAYLDVPLLAANGISAEYKSYDYAPYPQLWGKFVGTVSVLDLIANVGPSAREHLSSRSPNIPASSAH
jgi:hypothetical protein